MQRDQKIGLALGILLIGAVAAFFFRHEEAPSEALPTLQTADELDHRIAERDRAPYLQGGEPDKKSDYDALFGQDPWSSEPGGLVPEPIPLGNEAELHATPVSSAAAATTGVIHHVVQRGETLSSIATKYLGSATRFEEIFTANADRLRSANDLRVGMELRIPSRDTSTPPRIAVEDHHRTQRDGTAVNGPATAPSSPPSIAPESSGAKKFESYRRSPLTPQGTDPQSTTLDPKDQARRRLTQLPPRGDVSPPR